MNAAIETRLREWDATVRHGKMHRSSEDTARALAQPKLAEPRHAAQLCECPCPWCGDFVWYSAYPQPPEFCGWDTSFCRRCDQWLTPPCTCGSCSRDGRPTWPSEVPHVEYQPEPFRVLRRHDRSLLPWPGREGEPGVALVPLPLGPGLAEVYVGMEICPGSASNPNAYYSSRVRIDPRGLNLLVALAQTWPGGILPREDDLAALRLPPGGQYELWLGQAPSRKCRIEYHGLFVHLMRADEQDVLLANNEFVPLADS